MIKSCMSHEPLGRLYIGGVVLAMRVRAACTTSLYNINALFITNRLLCFKYK
jgi:hypothetical protein